MLAVMVELPSKSANRSVDELTTKFIIDVNPDDIVKGLFGGGKAELAGPLWLEIARPAVDYTDDEGVRFASDPPRHPIAPHPLQGRDLLPDGRPKARHGEV